eukprot:588843-Rhodomonas_salina.1
MAGVVAKRASANMLRACSSSRSVLISLICALFLSGEPSFRASGCFSTFLAQQECQKFAAVGQVFSNHALGVVLRCVHYCSLLQGSSLLCTLVSRLRRITGVNEGAARFSRHEELPRANPLFPRSLHLVQEFAAQQRKERELEQGIFDMRRCFMRKPMTILPTRSRLQCRARGDAVIQGHIPPASLLFFLFFIAD